MKPLAVFTIARNEAFFLPRWLAHYAKAGGDLYVLDHDTDDGSASGRGFTRVPVTNPVSEDTGWLLATVEGFQRELLRDYGRVVFAEADEFLFGDFGDPGSPPRRATGFDVCPGPSWKRNGRYDKTLASSAPLSWEVGFHRLCGHADPDPDPGLVLVHLHWWDREGAWDRLVSRMRGREPAPGDLGWQNKIRDRGRFDAVFDAETAGASPVPGPWQTPVGELLGAGAFKKGERS